MASSPNTSQHFSNTVTALATALVAAGGKHASNTAYTLTEAQHLFAKLNDAELTAIAAMCSVTIP